MIVTKDVDFELIRKAGKLAGHVLETIAKKASPGMSTWEIDAIAEKMIREEGAVPTFKGYRNFPATVCISINEEVVHGIPRKDRIVKDGDVLSLDIGVTFQRQENGKTLDLIADTAVTVPVGNCSSVNRKLMTDTKEALYAGIRKCFAGNCLNDIGGAIEDLGKSEQYGIVQEYGGHGIGYVLHEEPFIFNYRTQSGGKVTLKPGMVIAIEPMFNLGGERVRTKKDGWTVVTQDYKPSAHFEHSILITEGEPEILTKRPNEDFVWPSKA
ncbi:MAG: type I methionyl aminopeptidase [Candidatus Obscuribacterales bacterium]|nr:type I methionyl aminopeptidase [Candidatus Obscuribacterales bacterium]